MSHSPSIIVHKVRLFFAPVMAIVVTSSSLASIERLEVTYDYVAKLAEARASSPYNEPDRELPKRLAELNYDQNRDIRFKPDQALWRREALPFQLHLFHRTSAAREAITIREFSSTHVQTLPFIRDFFDYGKLTNLGSLRSSLGYAGFRLHYPLNRPDVFDEVIVFHGASYFRALGAGQVYGLSARGLAVDSGVVGKVEEFPVFTDFWIGKPRADADSMRVYALLDSRSVAGAYEFVVRPGRPTTVDVKARLFAREAMDLPGLAPLTSMYWFGKNADRPQGDPRPQVHDSDGLIVHTADGVQIWRPLQNPGEILNTDFALNNPVRFGLAQRERSVFAYEDFETRYHDRPSAWVEPTSEWGKGVVRLVELPTRDEYGDNIVAYWVPEQKPEVGKAYDFSYRMVWSLEEAGNGSLARVLSTRKGNLPGGGWGQLYWIDFSGGKLAQLTPPELSAEIEIGAGAKIKHQTLIKHPGIDGWRVALQIEGVSPPTDGEKVGPVNIKVRLRDGYQTVSETWAYTWVP